MKLISLMLILVIGSKKSRLKHRVKQYDNYETISRSRVPLSYRASGDSVTINGNDMQ